GAAGGHSREPALSAPRSPRARQPHPRGARLSGRSRGVAARGDGLSVDTGDQAADARFRPHRLPRGAGRMDRGEVSHVERLRRRRGAALLQGRTAHQHHAVLGHGRHQLLLLALLRALSRPLAPTGEGKHVGAPPPYGLSPRETVRPPRSWAERVYNIRRWTVMPAGGHFAALEEPQALVDDLRAFFRDLR